MRKPIIVGNWKMNNGPAKAQEFAGALKSLFGADSTEIFNRVDFAIAAPYLSLGHISSDYSDEELNKHEAEGTMPFFIPLAAQNVNENESGAFTGETSISMLQEYGVEYVIIGHSERREMYNETDASVNAKLKAVAATLASEEDYIIPIVAFGETKEEFEAGKQEEIIRTQLTDGIKDLTPEQMEEVVLAYEPIWAIGTGLTATPEQAQAACAFSRSIVAEMYGQEVADKVRIQYGGSMNPGNVKELMAQPDIDGGLVGGASLDAASFFELLNFNK